MNEPYVTIIKKYIELYLSEPEKGWSEDYFFQRSCARWAAMEVLSKLSENELEDPFQTIEDFYYELEDYRNSASNQMVERPLAIAEDTVESILCLFI